MGAAETDQIDFALALFLLTLERLPHIWPITQISEFR